MVRFGPETATGSWTFRIVICFPVCPYPVSRYEPFSDGDEAAAAMFDDRVEPEKGGRGQPKAGQEAG